MGLVYRLLLAFLLIIPNSYADMIGGGSSLTVGGSSVSDPDLVTTGDVDPSASGSSIRFDIDDNGVDGTEIAIGSDAQGDVIYYDGTNFVRLPKGTAGQVLEMNAGATAPEWDTDDGAAGGDSITVDGAAVTDPDFGDTGDVNVSQDSNKVRWDIEDNGVDGTEIAIGSDAQGDVIYYDGTNWVRLAKGTAGQVLEMNAGATAPEWDVDGGGASELSIDLMPYSAKLPTTSPMAIDAGEKFWRLLSDSSTEETALYTGIVIDDDYGAGALSADIYSSATAVGGITFAVNIDAITPLDVNDFGDTFTWGGRNSGSTYHAVVGRLYKTTITLTNADSLAAGDLTGWAVIRVPSDASDTAAGDAEIRSVVIRE